MKSHRVFLPFDTLDVFFNQGFPWKGFLVSRSIPGTYVYHFRGEGALWVEVEFPTFFPAQMIEQSLHIFTK